MVADRNKFLVTVLAGVALTAASLYALRRWRGGRKLDAIVISGPSGVGKGTVITRMMAEHPEVFGFSVSHTTRSPRQGEVDGKHYHFVSKESMQKAVDNDEFLENCDVHGNLYGTSKKALKDVTDQGKVAIIEMDVQGAQKLKKRQGNLHFHYIFMAAPMEELEKRIIKRGSDAPEKVKVRLETARGEFAFAEKNPQFFHSIIRNDNVDDTYRQVLDIVRRYGVKV